MGIQGKDLELLGVTLFGPAPLVEVNLALEPRLTVAYGMNGSGKTTLLKALEALLGEQAIKNSLSAGFAHFRVRQPGAEMGSPLMNWLHDAAWKSLVDSQRAIITAAHRDYPYEEDQDEAIGHWLWAEGQEWWQTVERGWIPRTWQATLELYDKAGLLGPDAAIADAVQRDPLITISGPGSRHLSISAWPTPELLAVARPDHDYWRDQEFYAGYQLWRRVLSAVATGADPGETPTTPPPDVPVPLFRVGPLNFRQALAQVRSDVGELESVNVATLDRLTEREGDPSTLIDLADGSEFLPRPEVITAADHFAARANLVLHHVLPDAPSLEFELGTPDQWARGTPPTWVAHNPNAATSLRIEDLSEAEQRWALVAIQHAVNSIKAGEPSLLLLDEPEGGLHRRAESAIAATLHGLVNAGSAVIAASHSPALLADTDATLLHVQRCFRGSRVVPMPSDLLSNVDRSALELGLSRADLLSWVRVVVVVEGMHDVRVLESLLADDLSAARAYVLPIHGAKRAASAINSPFLFDFTDAQMVLVLDNLHRPAIDAFEAVKTATEAGDHRARAAALDTLRNEDSGEARWLHEFASEAAELDRSARTTVFGLELPDIVCYLDPATFGVPEPWDEVINAWRTLSGRDIKKWVHEKYGTNFNLRSISQAAAQTSIPPELERLGLAIRGLAWSYR